MGTGGDLSITDEGSSDEEGPACGHCYGCREDRDWCTHAAALQDVEVVEAVQAAAAATTAAATTAAADGSGPAGDSLHILSDLGTRVPFSLLIAHSYPPFYSHSC